MSDLCCDYRDHSGLNGCACPEHPKDSTHPFGAAQPLTEDDISPDDALYAWIVDADPSNPDDAHSRVGVTGPSNAPQVFIDRLLAGEGKRWRTKYEKGEDPEHDDVVHVGRILWVEDGWGDHPWGPLEDLSRPDCGAVDIEYWDVREGDIRPSWVPL